MHPIVEKSLQELRDIYWNAHYERKNGKESFGCRNYIQEEDLLDAGILAIAAHVRKTEVKPLKKAADKMSSTLIGTRAFFASKSSTPVLQIDEALTAYQATTHTK